MPLFNAVHITVYYGLRSKHVHTVGGVGLQLWPFSKLSSSGNHPGTIEPVDIKTWRKDRRDIDIRTDRRRIFLWAISGRGEFDPHSWLSMTLFRRTYLAQLTCYMCIVPRPSIPIEGLKYLWNFLLKIPSHSAQRSIWSRS